MSNDSAGVEVGQ